jgi:hypothetical protein
VSCRDSNSDLTVRTGSLEQVRFNKIITPYTAKRRAAPKAPKQPHCIGTVVGHKPNGGYMKLERPTVGDVVKLLQKFPQEAPFRINTADTYWGEEIIHIKIDRNGRVLFCGEMRK